MFLGILCLSCLPLFSSARCARTHSESVLVCMQARVLCTPAVGFLFAFLKQPIYFTAKQCTGQYLVFCLLYFLRLAALAPTGHCQGIVSLGQVLWDAVPFLLAIFSFGSLRSHTLSKCFRLQALAFGFLLAIVFFGSLRSHPQGTLRVL